MVPLLFRDLKKLSGTPGSDNTVDCICRLAFHSKRTKTPPKMSQATLRMCQRAVGYKSGIRKPKPRDSRRPGMGAKAEVRPAPASVRLWRRKPELQLRSLARCWTKG